MRTMPGISSSWKIENSSWLARKWFYIIESYAQRNLTVSNDKLIAISGIARLFASRFGASYVAGLWKTDLELQLVWYRWGESYEQPEGYRAPSWSWASGDGEAGIPIWFRSPEKCFLSIEDVSVTLSTDDPFGHVNYGYIRVKCQTPACGTARKGSRGFQVTLSGFTIINSKIFPDSSPHCLDGHLSYMPGLIINIDDICDQGSLWGLVLEATGQGKFRRVGAFVVKKHGISTFWSKVKESLCTQEHGFGEPVGVDGEGNSLYIITII
jgi:hypothetical protein